VGTGRLEAFSDGVIAIIIIMVLGQPAPAVLAVVDSVHHRVGG
jgi:uncharacterized membrane protein